MRGGVGPLSGKRVLVTRAEGQDGGLSCSLEALGALVISIPTISAVPVPFEDEVRSWPAGLSDFGWAAFASQNGVRFFWDWLESSPYTLPGDIRVAAVGEVTGRALEERGIRVELVPATRTGRGLGRELRERYPPSKVLLPRGRQGRNEIAESLSSAGWEVVPLVCYETVAPRIEPAALAELRTGVDAALFASPSSIKNLWSALGDGDRAILTRAALVPIGETTRGAIEDLGLSATPCPEETSCEGLVARVVSILAAGG